MEWLQNDGPGIVCHDAGLILLHNEVIIPSPATFLDLWCKPRHTPVLWALWPSEAKELALAITPESKFGTSQANFEGQSRLLFGSSCCCQLA